MKSIYNLTAEANYIASLLTEGELTPEIENALVINQTEIQKKSIDYAYVIKSFESDISAVDAEIKRLQEIKRIRVNAIDRMKEAVKNALELHGMTKIESPTVTLAIKQNPESVEVVNEAQVPAEFWREKITRSIDKVELKKALKDGEQIEGAILVRNTRLDVK